MTIVIETLLKQLANATKRLDLSVLIKRSIMDGEWSVDDLEYGEVFYWDNMCLEGRYDFFMELLTEYTWRINE